jgi:hypothetical protein
MQGRVTDWQRFVLRKELFLGSIPTPPFVRHPGRSWRSCRGFKTAQPKPCGLTT